ncbi:MAG: hypothetical protein U1F76_12195 [Candidatus Competibacteraceae bacterium]
MVDFMIRRKDKASIKQFFYWAWQLHSLCIDKEYRSMLAPFLVAEQSIDDILENIDDLSLDPAITTLRRHWRPKRNLIVSLLTPFGRLKMSRPPRSKLTNKEALMRLTILQMCSPKNASNPAVHRTLRDKAAQRR